MSSYEALQAALPKLSATDRDFAESMLAGYRRWGSFTDKQMTWVRKLVEKAVAPVAPRERHEVGSLSGVLSLFQTAKAHLKRPAIVLGIEGVGAVKISVAGPGARVPGSLNVADAEGGYGEGRWFGRILTDGTFEVSPRQPTPAQLVPALREFAEKPAEVAARHGRLTGLCCFCNRPLKDERSTDAGYGPVCAERWGLQWGAKRPAAKPLLSVAMSAPTSPEDDEREMQRLEAEGDRRQTIRDETAKWHHREALQRSFGF